MLQGKRLKSFLIDEVEKLKRMSGRDRLWYVWEYYKYIIIIGILVLSCIISILINLLNPSNIYLNTITLNLPSASQKIPTQLTDGLHTAMGLDKYSEVKVEEFYINFKDQYTEQDYQSVQRLFTLIGVREVDIILTGQEELDALASQIAFFNLEDGLPQNLWNQLQSRIIYIDSGENAELYPAGIDISDTAFVRDCGYISQSVVFSIPNNTKNLEHCIEMLEYIFSYE